MAIPHFELKTIAFFFLVLDKILSTDENLIWAISSVWESAAFAMRRSRVRLKTTDATEEKTAAGYQKKQTTEYGFVAQLGERRVRNAEVRGSSPLRSTTIKALKTLRF